MKVKQCGGILHTHTHTHTHEFLQHKVELYKRQQESAYNSTAWDSNGILSEVK